MLPTQPLTLTPSRFGTDFTGMSSAIITPDRDVHYLGNKVEQVLLEDLQVLAVANLLPNVLVDEEEPFKYRVLMLNDTVQQVFHGFIVMPEAPATLFDLVPQEADLNSCVDTPLPSNRRA